MPDLKLLRLTDGAATELSSASVVLEKSLQTLVARNMETLFGVRFLDLEHGTGVRPGGRIDSLGMDENSSQSNVLLAYLKIDPDTVEREDGFSRDVRKIGHFGTGDPELRIANGEQPERALRLIQKSYEAS